MLVLHHLPDPAAALAEAARVLKPEGALADADMLPHDREEYRQQMGHVWLGFAAGAGAWAARRPPVSGESGSCRSARTPHAKGPALFVAVARRRHR